MTRATFLVLVLALSFSSAGSAQTAQRPGIVPPRDPTAGPRTGTAVIRGRVTSAESGAPVRRAQVQVMAPAIGGPRTTTTDGEGNYEITNLPAGTYSINATKTGLVSGQFGQRRQGEPGTPITLSDGQVRTRVDIALRRGGVIAVRVSDEFGEPIAGAQVQVQRYQYGPNGRQLQFSAMAGPGATDDLGQVRVYGLAPGEYVVSAAVRNFNFSAINGADDRSDGYPTTYYPGSANPADAQPVIVEAGQEAHAQFGLIAARLVKISGRVIDSQGRPLPGAQLTLMSPSGGGVMSMGAGQVSPDGTFSLIRVPPGDHVLRVLPRTSLNVVSRDAAVSGSVIAFSTAAVGGPAAAAADLETASVPLTVGSEDITGLTITTGPAGKITGRVVFEGTSARPATASTRVMLQPLDSSVLPFTGPFDAQSNGQVGADGTFTLRAMAGKVLVRATNFNAGGALATGAIPPGSTTGAMWSLKSVTLNGADITDEPLELSGSEDVDGLRVVMTDRSTDVRAMVSTDRGQPADGFALVVLPQEGDGAAAQRFTRVMRAPAGSGQIEVRGLPPGRYVAMAFEALEPSSEWNPRVRDRVREAGEPFVLTEGEKRTLTLRIADEP